MMHVSVKKFTEARTYTYLLSKFSDKKLNIDFLHDIA